MGVIEKEVRFKGSKGEKALNVLFDSGASMSFIKERLASELDEILRLPDPLSFETARRGDDLIIDKAVRLDFYIDDDRMSDEFLVVSDEWATEDVIIGASTFQKWRLTLDFEKEDVYSVRRVRKHILK